MPLLRTLTTKPLARAPRAAMLSPRMIQATRTYAAEAGGKFSRSKPHFK
jgi:elongation factor Tu